ncbi:MAG: phosphoenolpyruvate carboxykinase [archaeon]|nr:phosphoenolpyruvate carboxykinase [archaeon]
MVSTFSFYGKQAIIRTSRLDWNEKDTILESELFKNVLTKYMKHLQKHNSELIAIFPEADSEKQIEVALELLKKLAKEKKQKIIESNPELKKYFSDIYTLDQFVEQLYNYWRNFERYLVLQSDAKNHNEEHIDKQPYRVFNDTIEELNHRTRSVYRDIRENITGEHPSIFRQMPAGCQVGIIAAKKELKIPKDYSSLKKIPIIRQAFIEPPLIIDPPMNKRKGEFKLVYSNPLEEIEFNENEWLCFPAKVGELVIHLYFHEFYTGIGIATANLFELCSDEDLKKEPDGIYAFGVPEEKLKKFAPDKTVFFNDEKNKLMVGVIPASDEFAYFGYVKKMMLTLYNSIMIARGNLPVHGAMTRITLKDGSKANVIIMGDSGTGKSESLEAFRILGEEHIKDMQIVFDDMGSLKLENGKILAYGTETGAFVRLDDLDAGYAFGNIDRSIIMSPSKVNARAVLPITTLQEILHGWPIDFFLYANNYEKVSDGKYIKKFESPEEAMSIFKEGKRMAKGTTVDTGIVGAYYANIFGPAQFKKEHDILAEKYFNAFFDSGIFVGQINTQLGVSGMERKGPQEAAKSLFELIKKK